MNEQNQSDEISLKELIIKLKNGLIILYLNGKLFFS
jgi:hypothetical protein